MVPLHEGMADPLVLLAALPLPLRFVGRDELLTWPHLGSHIRRTRQLVVPLRPTAQQGRGVVRSAGAALARGESIVIFAQGSVLGIEVDLHPGAVRLAQRLGVPILPVVISGTHRVWEHPYSPLLRFGQRVSVQVLEPIRPIGTSRREADHLTW